VENSLTF